MKRILIIDDEEGLCRILKKIFSQQGWEVECSMDGENIIELLNQFRPHCLILDMKLGPINGLDLIPAIHHFDEQLPILILTAFESVRSAVDAMKRGAFDYLTKPFDNQQIIALAERAATIFLNSNAVSLNNKKETLSVPFKEASKTAALKLEKAMIIEALKKSSGHQGKASTLLGITPRTLYNKIKELKLKIFEITPEDKS